MDNVQNKTAIVTGAGSGIGYYTTEELLHKGAKKVAIIDLPIERSYNASVSLQEKFGKERVIFFPTDLTNLESFKDIFKRVVKALNGLDILVNNAGICNENCVEQTFAINVVALIRGSLYGIDYMGKHKGGKGGIIINIASVAGLGCFPICPAYGSSKYAVVGFGINLEKHYDITGVRILTVCPSFTITEMFLNGVKCFDFVELEKMKKKFVHSPQSAAHVGQSIVEVIQKSENGSIWIVMNNEPPFVYKPNLFVTQM